MQLADEESFQNGKHLQQTVFVRLLILGERVKHTRYFFTDIKYRKSSLRISLLHVERVTLNLPPIDPNFPYPTGTPQPISTIGMSH